MPDFPVIANIDPIVISPASPQSLGMMLNAYSVGLTAAAWPLASKAYYIPFSVSYPYNAVKMFVINGGTVSGNIDVGIYDRNGTKIVTKGTTAHAGVSVVQEFDITDTLLKPGLYFMACAMDNATGIVNQYSLTGVFGRSIGVQEQASAFPLPTTSATFAALSGTIRIPWIGITSRTVV